MKRFMNVLLALSTAVIILFAFTGCNEQAEQPAKTEPPTKTEQPAGADIPAKGEHSAVEHPQ